MTSRSVCGTIMCWEKPAVRCSLSPLSGSRVCVFVPTGISCFFNFISTSSPSRDLPFFFIQVFGLPAENNLLDARGLFGFTHPWLIWLSLMYVIWDFLYRSLLFIFTCQSSLQLVEKYMCRLPACNQLNTLRFLENARQPLPGIHLDIVRSLGQRWPSWKEFWTKVGTSSRKSLHHIHLTELFSCWKQ